MTEWGRLRDGEPWMDRWTVAEWLFWHRGLDALQAAWSIPDSILSKRWGDLTLDDAETVKDGVLAANRRMHQAMNES